ncbi:hypothetical protein ACOSYY_01175, partial [Nitrospira sp. BLG_2]
MAEANPFFRQFDQIGGTNFPAERLTVRISHVVHDDEKEVRPLRLALHQTLLGAEQALPRPASNSADRAGLVLLAFSPSYPNRPFTPTEFPDQHEEQRH